MPIKRTLPGYPIYQGSKKISVIDMKGLVAYTPGGETINASQFGEGGIDFIEPMNKQMASLPTADASTTVPVLLAMSFSGTYFVTISVAATTVGAVQSVTIIWYVTATGVEAGAIDLSGEDIRFLAIFV